MEKCISHLNDKEPLKEGQEESALVLAKAESTTMEVLMVGKDCDIIGQEDLHIWRIGYLLHRPGRLSSLPLEWTSQNYFLMLQRVQTDISLTYDLVRSRQLADLVCQSCNPSISYPMC